MNWRLVLFLGITVGILGACNLLMAWPDFLFDWGSAGMVVIIAIVIARTQVNRFANGFCTGLLIGLIQLSLLLVFWDRFMSNNSEFVKSITGPNRIGSPQMIVITGTILFYIFGALIIGLLAWLFGNLFGQGKNHKAAVTATK